MTDYEILSGNLICGEYVNGELHITDEKMAPLYLCDFRSWAESRAVSVKRGFTSRNLKSASGLRANTDALETALAANCACVTDNYWVRPKGSRLVYEDVGFENYDGFFNRLALGLDSDHSKYRSHRFNPELTNIGDSDKAWIIEDGQRWLYKKQPLAECRNEVLASRIAEKLNIDTVRYELVYASVPDPEAGRYGIVRSKDFTQGRNINLEHAEWILRHHGVTEDDIIENAKIFAGYGLEHEYLNIKYLDIITGNPDRHSFNYGVLKSRESGEVTGFAPNYDNNYAFRGDSLDIDEFAWTAVRLGWRRPYLTPKKIRDIDEELGGGTSDKLARSDELQEIVQRRIEELAGIDEYNGISAQSICRR